MSDKACFTISSFQEALAFGTRLNPPLDGAVGFGFTCAIQESLKLTVPLLGVPKFNTGASFFWN
jgi:hypothetical protein